jgi:putative tryptophan/tyrosine transport system substrate-binding protein
LPTGFLPTLEDENGKPLADLGPLGIDTLSNRLMASCFLYKRREFITLLSGTAVAWPFVARAQQPTMPVVGLLRSTPAAPFTALVAALRQGLGDEGFVEGRNVAIEQRHADNQLDRLPALAADLVRRHVSVIVGNVAAVEAARAVTRTIPIVFVTGEDPIKSGLVASLNRPEANLTGVTFFGGSTLNAKQLELLRDLVPKTALFAVLGDVNYPAFEAGLPTVEAAGRTLGRQMAVVKISSEREFEGAFAKIVQAGAGALLVSGSPFFTSQRRALVALAARHAIPAIYDQRDFVVDGGLISYSASFTGAYRQAGTYVGKILKGAKPAELPVLQPTSFELVLNLKTAKTLGLDVPPSLLVAADEVIE